MQTLINPKLLVACYEVTIGIGSSLAQLANHLTLIAEHQKLEGLAELIVREKFVD